jgi:hypothetical protein
MFQHLLDSADAGNLFATNNTFKAANTDDASERQSRPRSSVGFIATGRGRLHAVPEVVVARDIHDRKGRLEMQPAMRTGQHGHLSAFAGMTPVAMATATACVKFMQLNLWRAVSR